MEPKKYLKKQAKISIFPEMTGFGFWPLAIGPWLEAPGCIPSRQKAPDGR
jgi:hypothetical protein